MPAWRCSRVIVPPGESSKSYAVFEQVCEAIIAARIERGDLVIALGGGVIGDLAGFAAAVVRRGLDYVQVPTTLLAQVDSSVGGKTAIDSAHGKNLIGAFHQPILVVADTALLDTLPEREFRAGYAEVAKYGLLGDAAFFAWLEANWRGIFSGGASGSSAREHAIARVLPRQGRDRRARRARDRRSGAAQSRPYLRPCAGGGLRLFRPAAAWRGDRHWHGARLRIFGTAPRPGVEGRGRARHPASGGSRPADPDRDIPGELPSVDQLMELIAQDKKVKRGMLTFILVRGIGAAFVEAGVDAREVRAFLSEKLAEAMSSFRLARRSRRSRSASLRVGLLLRPARRR